MDREITLAEHLNELRKRIFLSLAVLVITSIACFPIAAPILKILQAPAQGVIEKLVFFSPQEAFSIYLRIACLCGGLISLPFIFYQVWAFISPAIEERLKMRISYFISFATLAFTLGALFAYFVLIPPALRFLLSFATKDLEPVISASRYISFVSGLIFGCGLVFELPFLSLLFTKLGIINARLLRKKYKYAIVIIFILAAVITPTTDAVNMLLLALPMVLLYEVGIWVSSLASL